MKMVGALVRILKINIILLKVGEVEMSNLEHLIENGLCRLSEGKSYRDWHEIIQQDCNWEGNENITIDNLWEICQYVIFVWDIERTIAQCKDCKHDESGDY